ncbi:xanthine dehydrogenase family protein molybdopterin-binding subunit [Pseudomonas sp. MTM4]|uniref:xanthine dehydrogenase family protein molybdopterin-binding subunit n=1 Tax=unclassified Pseudomonas TaxID=196821 RepID=UPI0018D21C0F|nr:MULTISPECIES: xanthine dehydrogenase family protein molybdopterin-binding subunit [unclassified Pseudomonas]MBC8650246.1 xanthine dehydrogenase family protein molybdopterin-binding subunit [Pseudomonas sp. MT4]QXY93717.1 xanthine dehydrogenase family protein molybdopterin-binding subunit [Pseudomonas sp. MTM4]
MRKDTSLPGPAGLSRRTFLKAAGVGGALLLSVEVPLAIAKALETTSPANATFNAFVRIDTDNTVTLVMPRVEMGQGTYTSLSMLIAEELEVDPANVHLEHAAADDLLYAPAPGGQQITGGSDSVRTAWLPMREAGAAARMMLVAAAANAWGVPVEACIARDGSVVHEPTGRQLRYGALAAEAAKLPVPEQIALKDPKQFRLIGSDLKRLDGPAKVDGSAQFGIDVKLPGLRVVTVASSPFFGGRVKSLEQDKALVVRGVRQVVRLDDVVAIVADHMAAAQKGLAAAQVQWEEGPAGDYSTQTMLDELAAASRQEGVTARQEGDVAQVRAAAEAKGHRSFEAVYQQPLLAHATMEPMNCTVRLGPQNCEIWLGTQVPTRAQAAAAQVAGLPVEKVQVHNQYLGGGFGRRLEVDYVIQAVRIAREVDGPIKVIWSREEDMQHSAYRPYHYNRLSATLDEQGRPLAWHHRVTGSSIMARFAPGAFTDGIDVDAIRDAAGPYEFPNLLVQFVRQEPPEGLLTSWWRGVGHMQNAIPVECFIDELAQAAGEDAIAYRKPLLQAHPRALRVLEAVAEKAGWDSPLPDGRGRGIALTFAFQTYAAQVVEVSLDSEGKVRTERVVTVVDCGRVVSPATVEAQVQGGTLFGLSAALFGNITIKGGRIEQSNFHDYRVLRMNETPVMETHILPSTEAPTGIGEISTVLITPALLNAVHNATGQRVRKLPLSSSGIGLA